MKEVVMEDEEILFIEFVWLIWNNGLFVVELYKVFGIDLDDIKYSDFDYVVVKLGGIIIGWQSLLVKEQWRFGCNRYCY